MKIAAEKASRAGLAIEWQRGFSREAADFRASLDKAVSSLVFHQVPVSGKREGVAAMFAGLRRGGEVHIADYARQPGLLMRSLFLLTVQWLDGVADTQSNADGALEAILSEHRAESIQPTSIVRTATGAISLFRAIKPS